MSERPNHMTAGAVFVAVCVAVSLLIYLILRSPSEPNTQHAATVAAASDEEGQLDIGSTYGVASSVRGASFVNLDDLPHVPPSKIDSDDPCADQFIEPATAGGRIATRRGWRITQEEKVENLNAILIVRGLNFIGSGRCEAQDANIALFYEQRLVGVLYSKGRLAIDIARMEPRGDKLRVWSAAPFLQGEMSVDRNAVAFDQVTGSDAVCDGTYRVPPVFNRRYSAARNMLISSGWRPVPGQRSSEFSGNPDAREQFPELGECASTGYAECEFLLTPADGRARLRIITLGDDADPQVSSYDAQCG